METRRFMVCLLICLVFVAGCTTYPASIYNHSVANIQTLKMKTENRNVKIRMNEFTAAVDVEQSITCRGAGPVMPSPGKTYQKYIRDALYDEIVLAGLYKDDANISLDGKLEVIDFSSGITDAEWDITIYLKSTTGASIRLTEKFPFSSSFDGGSACRNTANAFNPAVQSLINKIVSHPDFDKLLTN